VLRELVVVIGAVLLGPWRFYIDVALLITCTDLESFVVKLAFDLRPFLARSLSLHHKHNAQI